MESFYKYLWSIPEKYSKIIEKIGDVLQIILPSSFLVYVILFGSTLLLKVYCIAFFIAIMLVQLTKCIFNNPRPYQVEGFKNPKPNVDWSPIDGNSLMSGHTAISCLGSLFWFTINPIYGIIGLMLGLFVGLSRIIAKMHWLRDVLCGVISAIIIFSISLIFI